ncbi:MAG: alkaline phosphatase PhoX [Methyloglobulus sp.]|nr:DUF839 domain-containing protein [Methyloglobulus sp.]
MKLKVLTLAVSAVLASTTAHAALDLGLLDFGQYVEKLAQLNPSKLFGTTGALDASSRLQASAEAAGCDLIKVAPGLTCNVVSEQPNLGPNTDMMALYPNSGSPSHLITCNEQDAASVAVQRIDLATGVAEDIISSGLTSCDPVEMTPWGTVIVGEEAGINGRMFEILDPLNTSGVTVTGSGELTKTFIGETPADDKVRYLAPLGQLSFEGISVLPNGVTYYQDENRPGKGISGGGYFKFIPKTLWKGGAPITDLNTSPLAAGGRVFALRLGKNNGNTDFGSGNNAGRGVWVEVTDGKFGAKTTTAGVDRINLRAAAETLKATTGYRPEDQDIDPLALSLNKVRICGTNTGQDTPTTSANGDKNYGTTFCITDGTVPQAGRSNTIVQNVDGVDYSVISGSVANSIPEYQTLVNHYLDFGMPDNIAFQPGRSNIIIQEDGDGASYNPPRNNDIWDCMDDGKDKDLLSDGCIKIATLNDLTAESTGGVFDATGSEYYLSIQHNITGHGVIVKLTGWR